MLTTLTLRTVAVLGTAGLALAGMPAANADDDSDGSHAPQVIATGLDNPRGVAVGPDDAVYVAESGAGGTETCFTGPEGPSCFGTTGAVTRIDEDGQERVLEGMPSVGAEGTGDFALGPVDLAFDDCDTLFVTVGLGFDLEVSNQIPELADMGVLVEADTETGDWETVADLAEFEDLNNPTGDEENSNPNSLFVSDDGFVVADAGANDVLQVDSDGEISTLATFPNRTVDGMSMDEVPTSAVVGPDGALYVSQLTGFPFPVGDARVYRVEDGEVEVFATGFSAIIDLAFDEDDNLYVLEMFTNGFMSGDLTGALHRLDEDGDERELVTDALVTPGGMTIDGDHAYVSNHSISADEGEVLRIEIDD